MRIPHAWFAGVEDERYVMVFEDLEASGCRFPTPRDDDIAALGLDIVEQLAALHGRYWDSPRFDRNGDLAWLADLFVDAEGGNRTGFLDWAMLGRSPGLRDVAYALCNSIPADVRREHERTWLDRYCARLAEQGVTLEIDDAWRQYRLFALYSWLSATSTAAMGSKWQPLHVGLGGTRRATAACEDLNCVGLAEGLLAQS